MRLETAFSSIENASGMTVWEGWKPQENWLEEKTGCGLTEEHSWATKSM